jgi:hypothetical protein
MCSVAKNNYADTSRARIHRKLCRGMIRIVTPELIQEKYARWGGRDSIAYQHFLCSFYHGFEWELVVRSCKNENFLLSRGDGQEILSETQRCQFFQCRSGCKLMREEIIHEEIVARVLAASRARKHH